MRAPAASMRVRLGGLLRQSMQASVSLPAWLDPLKALWLLLGFGILRRRFMRAYQPRLLTCQGLQVAGAPAECSLNAIIFYRGVFEPTLSWLMERLVREGDLCVDVGANAGYFTLLAARQAGAAGRVIAVEPAPGNLRRLVRNVACNGFTDRVEVVDAACADAVGQMRFFVNTRNDMLSRLELPGRGDIDRWFSGRRHWREIQVSVQTLAGVLGARAADVSFIKLDVEGAEHRVVPDIVAHCTHERLAVALEVKPARLRETLAPFEAAGFHAYDLCNDYRWLLNARHRHPAAVSYATLYGRRRMVDLLLTRCPLDVDSLAAAPKSVA